MTPTINALLAAIRHAPLERAPREMLLDECADNPEVVRAMIDAAIVRAPDLTFAGFDVYRRPGDSREVLLKRFEYERGRLLRASRGFAIALGWLASREPLTKPNRSVDSYQMKHLAEREFDPDAYCSNGELLTAAVWLGIRFVRLPPQPYAALAVSGEPIGWRERRAAEREAERAARAERAAARRRW